MNGSVDIDNTSLLIASSLVLVSLYLSYSQKLGLEKETLVSVARAVVQLVIVGYILEYIFGLESPLFTTLLLLFMTFNAAYNASKRGKGINKILEISFGAIATGTVLTLSTLVFSGTIAYEPYQIIPVGGMIISNSMVALGVCYKQMLSDFKNKREEVETKLSLGADILPSSIGIIRDAIKTGMIPTIDSARTLGIVSLPGMMTGLILAGISPIEAIKYQIMVTFMLLSTTSISSYVACYLSYRNFFNSRKQLVSIKLKQDRI
jgi:putative ABC transport system permease protein